GGAGTGVRRRRARRPMTGRHREREQDMEGKERASFVDAYTRVLTGSWSSEEYARRLDEDPRAALAESGLSVPDGADVELVRTASGEPDLAAQVELWEEGRRTGRYRLDATCAEVLAGMDAPLMVAFTVYFWNRAQSLELARRVKQRWPRCVVVLGGNDVTNDADALFAEAPHVDVLVHGEGELRFREL